SEGPILPHWIIKDFPSITGIFIQPDDDKEPLIAGNLAASPKPTFKKMQRLRLTGIIPGFYSGD
ncbi:hypothetical protein OH427_26780, partial [Escherichia coli]|uniref:hypothetical protein n=1 Tax=Escherichia coli TaxID=562 RepID=UPI002FF1C79A